MAGWVALPDPVVALSTYRTYWEVYMGDLDTPYYDYFFIEFGMSVEEVEVLPGVFAEGVVWQIGKWLKLNLFLDAFPDADSMHCKYKETFFTLPT